MRHQPITNKDFGENKPFRTICQAHREIYHYLSKNEMSQEEKERCVELIKEAYEYGIKMSQKLHEYAGKEWIPDVFS